MINRCAKLEPSSRYEQAALEASPLLPSAAGSPDRFACSLSIAPALFITASSAEKWRPNARCSSHLRPRRSGAQPILPVVEPDQTYSDVCDVGNQLEGGNSPGTVEIQP